MNTKEKLALAIEMLRDNRYLLSDDCCEQTLEDLPVLEVPWEDRDKIGDYMVRRDIKGFYCLNQKGKRGLYVTCNRMHPKHHRMCPLVQLGVCP